MSWVYFSHNWYKGRSFPTETVEWIHEAGGGEWWALLDRDGTVLWDYLGHAWKISYHTVRGMIQTTTRLRKLLEKTPAE